MYFRDRDRYVLFPGQGQLEGQLDGQGQVRCIPGTGTGTLYSRDRYVVFQGQGQLDGQGQVRYDDRDRDCLRDRDRYVVVRRKEIVMKPQNPVCQLFDRIRPGLWYVGR